MKDRAECSFVANVDTAKTLEAEYTRQQVGFIQAELTTAKTFLQRATTEIEFGGHSRVPALVEEARTAYEEALKRLDDLASRHPLERNYLETRRQEVADQLQRFGDRLDPAGRTEVSDDSNS